MCCVPNIHPQQHLARAGHNVRSYLLSRDGNFVGFLLGLLLDELHHLVDLTLDLHTNSFAFVACCFVY